MENYIYKTTERINKAGSENKKFAQEVFDAIRQHMTFAEKYYEIHWEGSLIRGHYFATSLGLICISTASGPKAYERRIKFLYEANDDIKCYVDSKHPKYRLDIFTAEQLEELNLLQGRLQNG